MKRMLALLLCIALLLGVGACAPPAVQPEPTPPAAVVATPAPQPGKPLFTPGSYTANGNGYGGPLTLEVSVDEEKILSVVVTDHNETENIGSIAIDRMPQEMVANQSIAVDIVTGATLSSAAIRVAAANCLEQADGDAALYSRPIEVETSDEAEKLTADVAVIGAGFSGLCAAVRAGELGADVVILEKLSITGGCAKTSLGALMVCEVEENKDYHITDEAETLDTAMKRWMGFQTTSIRESLYPDEERLAFQLVQTMFTLDWLTQLGATFTPRAPIAKQGMALVQVGVPGMEDGYPAAQLLTHLKNTALEQGAQLRTDTRANELITEDGKIVGVRAQSKTGPVEVYADTVILACGGFAANPDMVKRLIPDLVEYSTITSPGNTGDGIVMAEAVGAALYEDQWIHNSRPCFSQQLRANSQYITIFHYDGSPLPGVSEPSYNRLMIDQDGNRFMNEAQPYSAQDLEMIKRANNPYWSIYDGLGAFEQEVAEQGIACGEVVKGETVEELAANLQIDPAVLKATFDRYTEMCQAGEDADFGKDASFLDNPIGPNGPYYAIHILPGANDTLGGIKTTFDQQVLHTDGSIIDGLYAVGSMTNRVYYNQYYFSGSQLTFAASTGKLAAEHALGASSQR